MLPNYLKPLNDLSAEGGQISLTERGYISQDHFISCFREGFKFLGVKTLKPGTPFKPTRRTVFVAHKTKEDNISSALANPEEGSVAVFEFSPSKYWFFANLLGSYARAFAIVMFFVVCLPTAAYQLVGPYFGSDSWPLYKSENHLRDLAFMEWVHDRNLPLEKEELTDEEEALLKSLREYIKGYDR